MNFDQFECLSFDCYGTLIDWETGIVSALSPILEAHDVRISREDLLELYGRAESEIESGPYAPYREVLKGVLSSIGEVFDFKPDSDETERFSMSVADWPAFSDSHDALKTLAKRYRLIILSNIDDDLFQYSQKLLGVKFDLVFTAQQIGSYKPSRRNFEYLIEHVGVPKNRLLHVAQSLFHDIAPANELGITTVWINRRHGLNGFGATPKAEAGPDMVVTDLASLALLAGS